MGASERSKPPNALRAKGVEKGEVIPEFDYGLNDRYSIPGRGNNKILFTFATTSKQVLGPIQAPIQWVSGFLAQGLEHEADHSPPSSAEVKKAWSCTSSTSSWRGA
jgi:hypothetical protein